MADSNGPYRVLPPDAQGLYPVVGPDGKVFSRSNRQSDAQFRADSLNRKHNEKKGSSSSYPAGWKKGVESWADLGSDDSTQPAPPPEKPSMNPMAYEVAGFGEAKDGFVVFDAEGGIAKTFDKKVDAEQYAQERRKQHLANQSTLQPQLETIAAKARSASTQWIPSAGDKGFIGPLPSSMVPQPPTPWVPSAGEKGFIGPLPQSYFPSKPTPWVPSPGQPGFVGPLPQSMIPKPPQGPTPWIPSPGQPGFVGPLPQSMTPQGPTPWVPSPGQPGFVGPLPQSFFPPKPTPWIPSPGQPGFVGPLPASMTPTPWVPSPGQPGFIGPLPASMTPQGPTPWVPSPGQPGFIGPLPRSHYQPWSAMTASQRAVAGVTSAFKSYQSGGGAAGIAAGLTAGIGGVTGAIAGGATTSVTAVASATAAFADLVVKMKAFSEGVVASNAHLAKWNGSIGTAYMQLAVGDFRRQVGLGRATQGTAITAVRAVDQMRDNFMGVDVLQGNVTNRAASFAASFAGSVGADLSKLANVVNARVEQADPDGLVGAGVGAALGALPGGAVRGFYETFMNDPSFAFNPLGVVGKALVGGLIGAQIAGVNAAEAKVLKLEPGKIPDNEWGIELNRWARVGPMLPRRAPRP